MVLGASTASYRRQCAAVRTVPLTARFQGVYGVSVLTPRQRSGKIRTRSGRDVLSYDGTDASAQRVLRAAQDRPLAEGDHALVPGQGRGHLGVRPRDPRRFVQLQAAVGHPAAALHQDQAAVRLRAVFAREYLRARRSSLPVLRRAVSHQRADLRSCRAGRPGRPEGLGEHRHLLRHLQSQEGRTHAGRSRHASHADARSGPSRRPPSASPSACATRPRAGATTCTGTSSSTTPSQACPTATHRAPRRVTAIRPLWAIEGGRITIEGTGFPIDRPASAGRAHRRRARARRLRVADARSASSCRRRRRRRPRRRSASTACRARRRSSRSPRRSRPACIRSTTRCSIATATSMSPTAARAGRKSRSRSSACVPTARARRSRRASSIRRRWRSIRRAGCTCRAASRAPSTASRRMDRATPFATDLGVACGLAFAPDGTLFVGDRSGHDLPRRSRGTRARRSRRCRRASRRFISPLAPDGALYVTAPTLSSYDAIYRIDPDGAVTRAVRRVRTAAGPRVRRARRRCSSSRRWPASSGSVPAARPAESASGACPRRAGSRSASPSIRAAACRVLERHGLSVARIGHDPSGSDSADAREAGQHSTGRSALCCSRRSA